MNSSENQINILMELLVLTKTTELSKQFSRNKLDTEVVIDSGYLFLLYWSKSVDIINFTMVTVKETLWNGRTYRLLLAYISLSDPQKRLKLIRESLKYVYFIKFILCLVFVLIFVLILYLILSVVQKYLLLYKTGLSFQFFRNIFQI